MAQGSGYDDNKHYEVKVQKPFEWPPGKRQFIRPAQRVVLSGKVLNGLDTSFVSEVTETTQG